MITQFTLQIPPLKSVRVEYLPSNTTSVLQLLNLAVIQNFKTLYRIEVIYRIIDNLNENVTTSINFLSAIRFLHKGWQIVTGAITGARCFRKVSFVHSSLGHKDHETQNEGTVNDVAENLWIQMNKCPEPLAISMGTFLHVED